MKRHLILPLSCLLLLALSGCMHAISKEGRAKVDSDTAFSAIYADPQQHLGERILAGGLILSIKSEESHDTLEVLAFELDCTGEPVDIDDSGERFLARTAQKLDERFEPGLLVTLTGTVAGAETVALTGRDYRYPLLLMHEVHLWDEPFRRGLIPGQDVHAPFYKRPAQVEGHENPYDPGYAPFPYTPYYYRD